MRPGAHIKAGVEVLEEILGRHRPAAVALSDWGKSHRFAGSGDRAAIGNLVYDALRRKRSLAAQMGSDGPRAVILAAAVNTGKEDTIRALCRGLLEWAKAQPAP